VVDIFMDAMLPLSELHFDLVLEPNPVILQPNPGNAAFAFGMEHFWMLRTWSRETGPVWNDWPVCSLSWNSTTVFWPDSSWKFRPVANRAQLPTATGAPNTISARVRHSQGSRRYGDRRSVLAAASWWWGEVAPWRMWPGNGRFGDASLPAQPDRENELRYHSITLVKSFNFSPV
jgi:hypothetical protein